MLRKSLAVLGLALSLALSPDSLAQSQQRPPATKPVQTRSGPPAQPAAPDQRGTEQAPLSVKILPAEKPKAEAAKEEQQRQDKADTDKRLADETQRLADYTGWLVLVTIFLFGTAVLQVGLFWFQLRLLRRSATDATVAAEAARDTAKLTRDEFIATHRPRLRVRRFNLHPLKDGEPIIIDFVVANVGDTPAYVTRLELILSFTPADKDAKVQSWPLGNPFTDHQKIVGGAQFLASIGRDPGAKYDHFWQIGKGRGDALTLTGTIEYVDDNGVTRRTAFIRHCVTNRFVKSQRPDPDFEYED